MMPLSMIPEGQPSVIKKIGGKEETRRFLENLGFVVGGTVTVISQIGGNMIVNVKDARVAIGKEMARQFLDMGFYIGIGGVVTFKNAKTLKEVACGETVKVKKLTGVGAVKRRIMDMGITKGTDVLVRKVAPLGDPIEVSVRGYELSLRKADAEMIEVE